jgi:hypothetical protein
MLKEQITPAKLAVVTRFNRHIINTSVISCTWQVTAYRAVQISKKCLSYTQQQIRFFLFKPSHQFSLSSLTRVVKNISAVLLHNVVRYLSPPKQLPRRTLLLSKVLHDVGCHFATGEQVNR